MKLLLVGISENSSIRGVERYMVELVKSLSRNKDIKVTLLCAPWQKYFLENSEINSKVEFKIVNIKNSKSIRHLYHWFVLPFFFRKYDLVHILNTNPLFFTFGSKVVISIHDIAEYYVPEKYSFFQCVYRRGVSYFASKFSDCIVTPSDYTRKTLIEKFKISDKKVHSIYLGVDQFSSPSLNTTSISVSEYSDYFLYWGVIERSKGVIEALKAFEYFKENYIAGNENVRFVLAGKMGNAKKEVESFFLRNDVSYLQHVSDELLLSLAKNAKGVIFLSRFEGFGLPALEGFMMCDNVIASSTTSVGEISKKFAFQVDPTNTLEVASAMDKVIKSPKAFSYEEKRSILEPFSWSKHAYDLKCIYLKLISEK